MSCSLSIGCSIVMLLALLVVAVTLLLVDGPWHQRFAHTHHTAKPVASSKSPPADPPNHPTGSHAPVDIPIAVSSDDLSEAIKDGVDGVRYFYYYSPRCGHCQKFNPTMDAAYAIVNDASILACDVSVVRPPADFKVLGVPHLQRVVNGKMDQKFMKDRTVDEVVAYLSGR
jgi:thiol-disulfide isomerase/thioredoxin